MCVVWFATLLLWVAGIHDKPVECSNAVYAELAKCWRYEPDQRPTFTWMKAFFGSVPVSDG